jgi:hypothetical protein
MNKQTISIFILSLVALFLLQNLACEKEPQCSVRDCPNMLQCFDNECGCGPGKVQIGTSICADPAYYHFLATGATQNFLPQNFLVLLNGNPDSLKSTNPNTPVRGDLRYIYEPYSGRGVRMANYTKYDLNPNGIVGDGFSFTPIFKGRPTGSASDGSCSFTIEGRWTSPDTITAVFRMLHCTPSTMPEIDSLYPVLFVKVK